MSPKKVKQSYPIVGICQPMLTKLSEAIVAS